MLEFVATSPRQPDAPLLDVMAHIGIQLGRVMERTQTEAALRKQAQALGERVKELECLYAMATLVAQSHLPLDTLCQGILQIMLPAWRYPDDTCGRLVLGQHTFATPNFQPTR